MCAGLDLRAHSGSLSSGLFQTSPCQPREQLWVRNRRCLGIRVSLWWEGSAVEGACGLAQVLASLSAEQGWQPGIDRQSQRHVVGSSIGLSLYPAWGP